METDNNQYILNDNYYETQKTQNTYNNNMIDYNGMPAMLYVHDIRHNTRYTMRCQNVTEPRTLEIN